MSKYNTLLNVLDRIRQEATPAFTVKYNPLLNDVESTNQARARAFIHLFLKVGFGILDFESREMYVTDGKYDGGVDGYFIDREAKAIYFIQSKFRTTEKNFENKTIELEDILVMDINRILEGEEFDEKGNQYNGKIKQLIRDIRKINDIARYRYEVILLANLGSITATKLRYLTGGYPAQIMNYEKCYERLLFPVISGTYFNAADLNINIDLSNKNAGSKISYTVQTRASECEITFLFVPTIEIAKILSKYKNSILKFNPRSYLDFEGQKVNKAIRKTILNTQSNEFALFNNGITMLSDETFINEKIGQKNKAQLIVKNPQIINGGQTSFTLSRIYEENINNKVEHIFENKEVLLKVITLIQNNGEIYSQEEKFNLIDDISTATNQQTPVINADRISNDHIHVEIQKLLFDRYGILYERKRGEFSDGLYNKYVEVEHIIERNTFFRIYYAANGYINDAVKRNLFIRQDFDYRTLQDTDKFNSFFFGYLFLKKLLKSISAIQKARKNIYGQVFAIVFKYKPKDVIDYQGVIDENILTFKSEWNEFIKQTSLVNKDHHNTYIDKETQLPISYFNEKIWYNSSSFEQDVINYFVFDKKIEQSSQEDKVKIHGGKKLRIKGLPTKEKFELNIKKYQKKCNQVNKYLELLNKQMFDLRDKIVEAESEAQRQSLEIWLLKKETKIKDMKHLLERYQKWINADLSRISELF
jgi:hypothetical protein